MPYYLLLLLHILVHIRLNMSETDPFFKTELANMLSTDSQKHRSDNGGIFLFTNMFCVWVYTLLQMLHIANL